MYSVYILELVQNKFFVKRSMIQSNKILLSIQSPWTRLYRPIGILGEIPSLDMWDEEKNTLVMMDRYGVDNVRGGSYVKVNLSAGEIEKALQTIRAYKNRCKLCEGDHFIKYCPMRRGPGIIHNDGLLTMVLKRIIGYFNNPKRV